MALSKLGSWARSGALKSVTLKLVDPVLASVLYTSSVWTKASEEQLALLRKVCGESGSLSGVKRRVEINSRLECALVEYAQRMSEYKGLDACLKNVQDAFDCELWVDGILGTWRLVCWNMPIVFSLGDLETSGFDGVGCGVEMGQAEYHLQEKRMYA